MYTHVHARVKVVDTRQQLSSPAITAGTHLLVPDVAGRTDFGREIAKIRLVNSPPLSEGAGRRQSYRRLLLLRDTA